MFPGRKRQQFSFPFFPIGFEIGRMGSGLGPYGGFFDERNLSAFFFYGNHIPHPQEVGGLVHFPPVHPDVPVNHELPRRGVRGRKTKAIDRVVQPAFQKSEKIFPAGPFFPQGPFHIIPEFGLTDPVKESQLLFLHELFFEVA